MLQQALVNLIQLSSLTANPPLKFIAIFKDENWYDINIMKTRLILIRHGETNKNIRNSLHGRSDSEGLNEIGIKQIEKTVEALKKYQPEIIYHSTEVRAKESAEILAEHLNIPHKKIEGLQERDWGVFTGKPWSEVKEILDPMTLEERYNYVPMSGESWKHFETRLINSLEDVLKREAGRNIIIVTHGGSIRVMLPKLLGVPREESFKYDPANASLTIF